MNSMAPERGLTGSENCLYFALTVPSAAIRRSCPAVGGVRSNGVTVMLMAPAR